MLNDLLLPPLPYGSGYANAYDLKEYRDRLVDLNRELPNSDYKPDLEFILSGGAAKSYADYIKHPHKYGY